MCVYICVWRIVSEYVDDMNENSPLDFCNIFYKVALVWSMYACIKVCVSVFVCINVADSFLCAFHNLFTCSFFNFFVFELQKKKEAQQKNFFTPQKHTSEHTSEHTKDSMHFCNVIEGKCVKYVDHFLLSPQSVRC